MNLIYTVVNYHTTEYIKMFHLFIRSLFKTSNLDNIHIMIITDAQTKKKLTRLMEVKMLHNLHFLEVPKDRDLFHVLLRKFDISLFPSLLNYDKVMYLDCDILVQRDVGILFNSVDFQLNKLYAMAEGPIEGRYWTLDLYKTSQLKRLHEKHVTGFNSGTFMFIPTIAMKHHFTALKELALQYDGNHFYDQSFMNYYFNTKGIAVTPPILSRHIKLFPDPNKRYPRKVILHFAGIGRYKEKAKMMEDYYEKHLAK